MSDERDSGGYPFIRVTRQQRRAAERRERKQERHLARLVAGAAMLFGASAAGAATIVVSSTADTVAVDGQCTLREAIANANLGDGTPGSDQTGGDCTIGDTGLDTIDLTAVSGTITLGGTELALSDAVNIQGPGPASLTIDGGYSSRIFYSNVTGAAVSLSGLTLTHGYAYTDGGGAVRVAAGGLTLDDVTLDSNESGSYYGGGALRFSGDALTITNSTISGNQTTQGEGGGVYARAAGNVTFDGLILSNNHSYYDEGGAYLYVACGNTVTIHNSTISGNDAAITLGGPYGGVGGMRVRGPGSVCVSLDVQNTDIVDNHSNSFDGGLLLQSISGAMTNVRINGNTALYYSGGLDMGNSTLTITGSTISGNQGDKGGGVYLYGSSLTIDNTTIENNQAYYNGGGFYAGTGYFGNSPAVISIQNSTISGNSSVSYGGGGGAWGAQSIEVVNSTVANNIVTDTASGFGGGLSIGGGAVATIEESTIAGNTAAQGGGVGFYHYGAGSLTVKNSIISGSNPAPATPTTGDLASKGAVPAQVSFSDIQTPNATYTATYGPGVLHVDPILSPLANNGGTTLTMRPGSGSLVINSGDPAFAPPPALDQRGAPRVSNGTIDMGAVEVQLGTIQLTAAATTVGEAAGSVTITATRTGGSENAVAVDYGTTPGSATSPADFTATAGTLSWADGDAASKSFSIPITNDGTGETTESFTTSIGNPAGGVTLGAPSTETVTILDDEVSTFQFDAPTYSVTEGGTATISVSRQVGISGAVSVDVVVTGGTATNGSDYTFTTVTLNWADGESGAKTFTILTTGNDGVYDPAETIDLNLQNASGGVVGAQSTTVVTIDDPGNPGTIEFASATFSGTEGGSATVTVNRTGGSTGPVNADVVITGGTSTSGADYTLAPTTTLSWADGDSAPKTITIPVATDAVYDPNETIDLQLQNVTTAATGAQSTATVDIADPGNPGTVEFSAVTFSGTEGGSATITVTRTGGTTGPASADIVVTGGTATGGGSDYTFTSPTTVSWADSDGAPKTVTIPLTLDPVFDPGETIDIALQNVVNATTGAQTAATVNIIDPGNPGSVEFSAATFSGTEGGNATITVTRTGGATGPASVDIVVTGGTATGGGSDYTFTSPTTVSWANGDATPKTVDIPLTLDAFFDPGETIDIALQNVVNAATGTQTTATVDIIEPGNPGTIAFSAATFTGSEGGNVVVTVNRVGGTTGPASVDVVIAGGTATNGSDYTLTTPTTLSWVDGDAAPKTITIPVNTDPVFDPNETIDLSLQNVVNGSLGSQTTATVTVIDPGNPGVIAFNSAAFSGTEGGSAIVTVNRTGGTTGPVSVDVVLAAGGTASGADFTFAPTTLTWADSDAAPKTVTIPLSTDAVFDPNETFNLALQNPSIATIGVQSTTTVTIIDPGNPGTISFAGAAFSGTEGGNAVVTVNRTGGATGPASVDVTITGGTANSGSDYTLAPTTALTWADGDAAPKTITIPLANDGTFDPGETITLALQNVTGGTAGAQTSATVTINEIGAPGMLQFSAASYSVSENGGAATITVDRIGGTNGAVSVNYATSNGSATDGADYTGASGTLNWADGDATSKTFTVPILDDNAAEGAETVDLTLSAPTNGATLGTASATLTIDDFEPGTISVAGGAAISVNEAAGTVTITVTRTNGSNGSVTVDFSTTGGTATAPGDFTATSGSVTWNDGDTTTRTITIPITVDSTVEGPESFTVNLSSPTAGAVIANPSVTVTILEVAQVPTLAFWMKLMLILTCAGVGVVMLKNGRFLMILIP